MEFPIVGQGSAALLKQIEDTDGAAKSVSLERRYKHVAKLCDLQKRRHNLWVLDSACYHRAHCLVLDGLNLFTTKTLINGGIPAQLIHVPNKSDYDAIVAANHLAHGNIYRSSVLQWVQALVSLTSPIVVEPSHSFASACSACDGIKTIWLDFTCRWSAHVERALTLLLSPSVMGNGLGDLYLTLNADTRCPTAMRADGARDFIANVVVQKGGSVEFPSDHSESYGNGMFILHAAVNWSSCHCNCSAGAALYERLRGETRAFRKEQNSMKARS